MTLEDLKVFEREFLTPAQAAAVIGCEPYAINVQAKDDPLKLGFPVCIMGSRVKIPRRAFIRWIECGNSPTIATGRELT